MPSQIFFSYPFRVRETFSGGSLGKKRKREDEEEKEPKRVNLEQKDVDLPPQQPFQQTPEQFSEQVRQQVPEQISVEPRRFISEQISEFRPVNLDPVQTIGWKRDFINMRDEIFNEHLDEIQTLNNHVKIDKYNQASLDDQQWVQMQMSRAHTLIRTIKRVEVQQRQINIELTNPNVQNAKMETLRRSYTTLDNKHHELEQEKLNIYLELQQWRTSKRRRKELPPINEPTGSSEPRSRMHPQENNMDLVDEPSWVGSGTGPTVQIVHTPSDHNINPFHPQSEEWQPLPENAEFEEDMLAAEEARLQFFERGELPNEFDSPRQRYMKNLNRRQKIEKHKRLAIINERMNNEDPLESEPGPREFGIAFGSQEEVKDENVELVDHHVFNARPFSNNGLSFDRTNNIEDIAAEYTERSEPVLNHPNSKFEDTEMEQTVDMVDMVDSTSSLISPEKAKQISANKPNRFNPPSPQPPFNPPLDNIEADVARRTERGKKVTRDMAEALDMISTNMPDRIEPLPQMAQASLGDIPERTDVSNPDIPPDVVDRGSDPFETPPIREGEFMDVDVAQTLVFSTPALPVNQRLMSNLPSEEESLRRIERIRSGVIEPAKDKVKHKTIFKNIPKPRKKVKRKPSKAGVAPRDQPEAPKDVPQKEEKESSATVEDVPIIESTVPSEFQEEKEEEKQQELSETDMRDQVIVDVLRHMPDVTQENLEDFIVHPPNQSQMTDAERKQVDETIKKMFETTTKANDILGENKKANKSAKTKRSRQRKKEKRTQKELERDIAAAAERRKAREAEHTTSLDNENANLLRAQEKRDLLEQDILEIKANEDLEAEDKNAKLWIKKRVLRKTKAIIIKIKEGIAGLKANGVKARKQDEIDDKKRRGQEGRRRQQERERQFQFVEAFRRREEEARIAMEEAAKNVLEANNSPWIRFFGKGNINPKNYSFLQENFKNKREAEKLWKEQQAKQANAATEQQRHERNTEEQAIPMDTSEGVGSDEKETIPEATTGQKRQREETDEPSKKRSKTATEGKIVEIPDFDIPDDPPSPPPKDPKRKGKGKGKGKPKGKPKPKPKPEPETKAQELGPIKVDRVPPTAQQQVGPVDQDSESEEDVDILGEQAEIERKEREEQKATEELGDPNIMHVDSNEFRSREEKEEHERSMEELRAKILAQKNINDVERHLERFSSRDKPLTFQDIDKILLHVLPDVVGTEWSVQVSQAAKQLVVKDGLDVKKAIQQSILNAPPVPGLPIDIRNHLNHMGGLTGKYNLGRRHVFNHALDTPDVEDHTWLGDVLSLLDLNGMEKIIRDGGITGFKDIVARAGFQLPFEELPPHKQTEVTKGVNMLYQFALADRGPHAFGDAENIITAQSLGMDDEHSYVMHKDRIRYTMEHMAHQLQVITTMDIPQLDQWLSGFQGEQMDSGNWFHTTMQICENMQSFPRDLRKYMNESNFDERHKDEKVIAAKKFVRWVKMNESIIANTVNSWWHIPQTDQSWLLEPAVGKTNDHRRYRQEYRQKVREKILEDPLFEGNQHGIIEASINTMTGVTPDTRNLLLSAANTHWGRDMQSVLHEFYNGQHAKTIQEKMPRVHDNLRRVMTETEAELKLLDQHHNEMFLHAYADPAKATAISRKVGMLMDKRQEAYQAFKHGLTHIPELHSLAMRLKRVEAGRIHRKVQKMQTRTEQLDRMKLPMSQKATVREGLRALARGHATDDDWNEWLNANGRANGGRRMVDSINLGNAIKALNHSRYQHGVVPVKVAKSYNNRFHLTTDAEIENDPDSIIRLMEKQLRVAGFDEMAERPEYKKADITPREMINNKNLIANKPFAKFGKTWAKATFRPDELPIGDKYGKVRVYQILHNKIYEMEKENMRPGIEYYVEVVNPQMMIKFMKSMSIQDREQLSKRQPRSVRQDLRDAKNRPFNRDELENLGGSLSMVPDFDKEPIQLHHNFHFSQFHPKTSYDSMYVQRNETRRNMYNTFMHTASNDVLLPPLKLSSQQWVDRMFQSGNVTQQHINAFNKPPGLHVVPGHILEDLHLLIPKEKRDVGGNFTDWLSHAANGISHSVTNAAHTVVVGTSKAIHGIQKTVHNLDHKIDEVATNVAHHESRYWKGQFKKAKAIGQEAEQVFHKPTLENFGKLGRATVDVAKLAIDSVENDPYAGVPVKVAEAVLLPELGLVKVGLDTVSMAAHGDFDGSISHVASHIAHKVAVDMVPELGVAENAYKVVRKFDHHLPEHPLSAKIKVDQNSQLHQYVQEFDIHI